MVITERHCQIFSTAVGAMHPLAATVLLLHGFDGMSDETISEITGASVERTCAIRADALTYLLSRCRAADPALFDSVCDSDLYGLYEAAISYQYISEKEILETWRKVHEKVS